MFISAETFMDIIGKLTSDPSSTSGNERRRAPRVGVRAKVEIEFKNPAAGGAVVRQMVQLRELSRSGIGFIHRKNIGRSEVVRASFDRSDGGVLLAEYQVCHCHQLGTTSYLIGASLKNVTEFEASSREALVRRLAS